VFSSIGITFKPGRRPSFVVTKSAAGGIMRFLASSIAAAEKIRACGCCFQDNDGSPFVGAGVGEMQFTAPPTAPNWAEEDGFATWSAAGPTKTWNPALSLPS